MREREIGEFLFKGYRVPITQDDKVLEFNRKSLKINIFPCKKYDQALYLIEQIIGILFKKRLFFLQ